MPLGGGFGLGRGLGNCVERAGGPVAVAGWGLLDGGVEGLRRALWPATIGPLAAVPPSLPRLLQPSSSACPFLALPPYLFIDIDGKPTTLIGNAIFWHNR